MTTYSSLESGEISPDELPYLERRSHGGFGMIMTAACYVHESGHAFRGQWSCASDEMIPSLSRTAAAIRTGGAMSVLQIHHGGRQCPADLCGGQPISASSVPAERPNAVTPREMTVEEIKRTVQDFADGARRGKEAGFDGVEIHGANTYLLQQFISPHSNRRTDEYGADKRRFSREITEAVIDAVGPDYPVGYRFSPEEYETPGIRMEDTLLLIDDLLKFNLAFLHISLGQVDQVSKMDADPRPLLTRISERIDGRVPLIGVGSVKSKADADRCLEFGADLVAIGRVAISEPEWIERIINGEPVRDKLKRETFEEEVTLPAGLATKIRQVEGWFPFEEPPAATNP